MRVFWIVEIDENDEIDPKIYCSYLVSYISRMNVVPRRV